MTDFAMRRLLPLLVLATALFAPGTSRAESEADLGSAADVSPNVGASVTTTDGPVASISDSSPHSSLRIGETLNFQIKWGVVPAGTATMSITEAKEVSGRPCLHVVATAVSNPVFDKVYPVRDQFESFMDSSDLRSWAFKKHLREGKFRRDQVVRSDHAAGKAYYHDGSSYDLTPGAYDVLSAFYYVRTLPLVDGDEYFLDSHSDKKNYPIRVTVHRRERVSVPAGTFDCVVVEPTLRSGDFFKNEGSLTIWLTDDERRMPVQMKSKIPVGSISVELESFERPGIEKAGSAVR